jgi:hypothetical protein
MERLVDRFLREEILVSLPLYPNQHAYQTGKSAETALHQLVVRTEKALDQREAALGVFLDIEGAFNNTSYDPICAALAKRGVSGTIIRWIRATLEGRLATATLGGVSRSVEVARGCPQGGVLSPPLWCLFVDELIARLNGGGIHAQGYADDLCLLAWENSRTQSQGSYNRPFILWKCGATSTACRLIQTRLDSSLSHEEGNSQGSLNHVYLGRPCDAPRRPSI